MNILVIEDDLKLSKFLKKGLKEEGFNVYSSTDGIEGRDLLLENEFDLAIVDLMLPGVNGLNIIDQIRNKNCSTPIIVLSAKKQLENKIKSLRLGADDFLEKPFHISELVERINAVIRRVNFNNETDIIKINDLTINLLTREVQREGKEIKLKSKEFLLLQHFIENKNIVLTKTSILEKIWGYDFIPDTNIVEVLVCRLRSKVDEPFETDQIYTVRGFGYVFKEYK